VIMTDGFGTVLTGLDGRQMGGHRQERRSGVLDLMPAAHSDPVREGDAPVARMAA
jgi:hypothetical protein